MLKPDLAHVLFGCAAEVLLERVAQREDGHACLRGDVLGRYRLACVGVDELRRPSHRG